MSEQADYRYQFRQNLVGAFLYNTVLIALVLLNPAFAGAAMALSSVTVVTNANRLRYVKLD